MMNQYDAEDIAQQTMELMLRVFETGHGPTDNPHGYVATVARRLVIKSRPVNVLPLPADALLIDEVNSHLDTAILRSVASLPPLERRIAWAHWVLDRPLAEIAAAEGLPTANAAARHLQRAKPKLRKILRNLVM